MILHSDLIQCATDLVSGKESPLVEVASGTEGADYCIEPKLAEVREAAAGYLLRAFEHAGRPDA